jgi:hypothetical protein
MITKIKKTREETTRKSIFLVIPILFFVLFLTSFISSVPTVNITSIQNITYTTPYAKNNLVNISLNFSQTDFGTTVIPFTNTSLFSTTSTNGNVAWDSSITAKKGEYFNTVINLTISQVIKYSLTTATIAYIYNSSTFDTPHLLGQASFVGDNATFSVGVNLTSGQTYWVVIDKGGSPFNNYGDNPLGTPVLYGINSVTSYPDARTDYTMSIRAIVTSGNYISENLSSCWYYNQSTTISITCNTNTSVILPYGSYKFWAYANDTSSILYPFNISANWNYGILENNITFNSTSSETSIESFIVNVTANNPSLLTAIDLIYKTTSYPMTNYGNGIWKYSFTPIDISNNSLVFQYTYDGIKYNSSNYSQLVNPILFGICNATLNQTYLNLSFADEANNSFISATIPSVLFNYWFGNSGTIKSYTYSTATPNTNYLFCFSPGSQNVTTNFSISYSNPNYATRTYMQGAETLSNVTTNKILYSLLLSSGQLITFQVVNPAQQPITGVVGNVTRNIGGVPTLVGSGISGSDGGISFFVNPLLSYTFSFSASGYSSYTVTTTPSQTSYTVTLGSSSTGQQDYTKNIIQTILPSVTTLTNQTTYNFNYTINSTYWNLDSFGFFIYGNDTILITSNSSTSSSGGIITGVINTLNYSSIRMNYFYVVNGTTMNSSLTWYVSNLGDSGYSILHFFTDLKSYIASGWFGMTNLTFAILIFLFIFFAVGTVSLKFGFTSHASIISILTGLVIFFDVGLGLDSYLNPLTSSGAVPYLPSALMLLISVATILRETTR